MTATCGLSIVTLAAEGPALAVPPALAELLALPGASAVKLTWIFTTWPAVSGPTLVQLNVPVPVELGAVVALTYANFALSNVSASDTVANELLPVLATWMLYTTLPPTSAWPDAGLTSDL